MYYTFTYHITHSTFNLFSLLTLYSFHFYSTFTFHTHPSTQWPIVPLSHLCRIYHNTFPYSLFIHFSLTLYSLTALILLSHTTSFTFSLQSLYHTHIFTFHLYLTYALILLVSHHLISHFAHTTVHLYQSGRLSLPFLHTSLLHISRYYLTHLKLLFQTLSICCLHLLVLFIFYLKTYVPFSTKPFHIHLYKEIKDICIQLIIPRLKIAVWILFW